MPTPPQKSAARRHPANHIARILTRLFGGDTGAGLLLICVAGLAIIAANSPWAALYFSTFDDTLAQSPIPTLSTVKLWINDALMAIFFFVVGLEIKYEAINGSLADNRRRRLPVLAAIAGMAVPAIIYLAIAGGNPVFHRGWAVPAATDIAFAVGVLALVGRGLAPSLRLFLLTVAIVDDLGAVLIIAVFFTSSLSLFWLGAALVVLGLMVLLARNHIGRGLPYIILAVILWFCVLHSGVHATIAGVAAALTIPLTLNKRGDSLLLRMAHALGPWNSYVIVPLFGFANAGVVLGGVHIGLVAVAVAAGLFFGKQIGILGAVILADKTGFAPRPEGASWLQIWGVAILGGIGFTMSLFIGSLAFVTHADLFDQVKIGVLAGSIASTLLGFIVLHLGRHE